MVRLLATFVVLATLSGCALVGAGNPTALTPTPPPGTLDPNTTPTPSTTYRTLDSGGRLSLLPGTHLEITFYENGGLGARAGCNYIGGKWSIDAGRLSVADLGRTLIGCSRERNSQDERVQSFLESSPSYRLEDETLTLADVTLVEKGAAPPDPIVGRHRYAAFSGVSLVVDGVERPFVGTLQVGFSDQGDVDWFLSPCGSGSQYVADVSTIDFSPYPGSTFECHADDALTADYLHQLFAERGVSYQANGADLVLSSARIKLYLEPDPGRST